MEDIYKLKCVCFDLSLSGLALEYNSYQEAEENTGCGSSCGMCIPYLEELINNKNDSAI